MRPLGGRGRRGRVVAAGPSLTPNIRSNPRPRCRRSLSPPPTDIVSVKPVADVINILLGFCPISVSWERMVVNLVVFDARARSSNNCQSILECFTRKSQRRVTSNVDRPLPPPLIRRSIVQPTVSSTSYGQLCKATVGRPRLCTINCST